MLAGLNGRAMRIKMFSASRRAIAGAILLLAEGAIPTRAQALTGLLNGRWTARGDCQAGSTLRLAGNLLRWTDAAGHVNTQRVVSCRADGIATRTIHSANGQPAGKV